MATGTAQLIPLLALLTDHPSPNLRLRRRGHRQVQPHHLAGQRRLRHEQDPARPSPDHHSSHHRNPRECHHDDRRRYLGPAAGTEQPGARNPEVQRDPFGVL